MRRVRETSQTFRRILTTMSRTCVEQNQGLQSKLVDCPG
jgi:hypothetical protein